MRTKIAVLALFFLFPYFAKADAGSGLNAKDVTGIVAGGAVAATSGVVSVLLGDGNRKVHVNAVPEIGASESVDGLILLAGMLLILSSRKVRADRKL